MDGAQPDIELAHATVLLDEAVDAVLTDPGGTYLDGTFGRGGHARLLLSRLSPQGRLVAIDRDPEAVHEASAARIALMTRAL